MSLEATSLIKDGPYEIKLGDVRSSELLISDLYLELRRKTRQWAAITFQTAQARMGYIGQHLVSVATGLPGGKSGARGHDLVHADGSPGEIKTCYRVDQLGKCGECKAGVSPDETECSECGSEKIDRKDDSKWLISLRNADEYAELLVPSKYYLVLFEFTDLNSPDTIIASIWQIDPSSPGFILCMVDYYENIRSSSKSKAPFNFWPYSLKFELMKPELIYRAKINPDDTINTQVFPGRDKAISHPLSTMESHGRAKVPDYVWKAVAVALGGNASLPKKGLLQYIEGAKKDQLISENQLADLIARELYRPLVAKHIAGLPASLESTVKAALSAKLILNS